MWALIVTTHEIQNDVPRVVLEHTFLGATKKEALHYSRSHRKTDKFYDRSGGSQAAERAAFAGKFGAATGSFQGIRTISEARWEKR